MGLTWFSCLTPAAKDDDPKQIHSGIQGPNGVAEEHARHGLGSGLPNIEEELDERRNSGKEAGTLSLKTHGMLKWGSRRGPRSKRVVPTNDPAHMPEPSLQHDSDVLLSDQAEVAAAGPAREVVSPTESWNQPQRIASRVTSRGNSSTGGQHRDMTVEELRALGFTLHSPQTLEKTKFKSQPTAILTLQSEEGFLQRGRPRNNLVPMHVNVTCRAYFGLSGLSDYGQVVCKLLKRDTLLTFAIQKALRNLKRGEPTAVSHVTPDPAGQTSSLLGMRITPCLWKPDSKHRRRGSVASRDEEEAPMPALAIEHNVPYDPAEVVPRLMRDYAVLSHVPAILTLIDFQGKVLYQNASSLAYMGDLLRVKYDNQLSDGLLRVLFMYDLHNLDQMLEDVLAGEEWRGVIQVPASLRRYLAASEGGHSTLLGARASSLRVSGAQVGSPDAQGRPSWGGGGAGNGTGGDVDVEFTIGCCHAHPFMRTGTDRQRRPLALAPPLSLPHSHGTASQAAEVACAAFPEPGSHPHNPATTSHLPRISSHHHNDSWEQIVPGGRGFSEAGEFGSNGEFMQPIHQQQQFQQRKFMTLLERQGAAPSAQSRSSSRPYASIVSNHEGAGYSSDMLSHVGVRPPSNASLAAASHAELARSSDTSGYMPPPLDTHVQTLGHAGTSSALPQAGSEAMTGGWSEGVRGQGGASVQGLMVQHSQAGGPPSMLEPVEEDEGAYDEMQACFHEVHAMSLLDPVLDKQVVMLVQTDVTARVELENKLADLTDAQLSMLEQLFPRHIIEYMLARVPNKGDRNLRDLANMHEQVMVLFCDVVGFTSMSKEVEPSEVMHFLNELYETFDKLVDEYDMYKLDIVGDCYIVVAGLIKEDQDGFVCVDEMDDGEVTSNAVRIMQFAKAMLRESRPVLMPHDHEPVQLRIGIHTGPLVSGLVGAKMPKFTLFGDTMNTASRMETCCKPGCVHVSDAFAKLLPHEEWGSTGGVQVKGKGMMQTYLWEPDLAAQQDLSTLDAAMAASSLQQRSNFSSAASVRSHFTSRTTRSRYTSISRRHSFGGGGGGGGGGDSSEQSDEPAGHPLLTILTNIRNGGPEDSCDADEPLAVEAGRGSFVRNRSSSTRRRQSHGGGALNLPNSARTGSNCISSGPSSRRASSTGQRASHTGDQIAGSARSSRPQFKHQVSYPAAGHLHNRTSGNGNANALRSSKGQKLSGLPHSDSYRNLARQLSPPKHNPHEGNSLTAALAAANYRSSANTPFLGPAAVALPEVDCDSGPLLDELGLASRHDAASGSVNSSKSKRLTSSSRPVEEDGSGKPTNGQLNVLLQHPQIRGVLKTDSGREHAGELQQEGLEGVPSSGNRALSRLHTSVRFVDVQNEEELQEAEPKLQELQQPWQQQLQQQDPLVQGGEGNDDVLVLEGGLLVPRPTPAPPPATTSQLKSSGSHSRQIGFEGIAGGSDDDERLLL